MFTNLIESDSHRKEFKRRSSFFLATVAAYAVILFGAGVASIYAYDAHLEAQTGDLEVLSWVPPVNRAPEVRPRNTEPIRRSAPSNAPVDRNITVSERTAAIAQTNDPTKVPDNVGIQASPIPHATGTVVLTNRNVDPPGLSSGNQGCVTCNGTPPVVRVEDLTPPPVPVVVKPPTQRVSMGVLVAHAISLPQPAYPPMARQIHLGGAVTVQILVDEQGKVISAQTVSGHPILLSAAKEAALHARFTPTMLSGQAVKVQGLITYNFVLQ
jgi:protein TonB